MGERGMFSRAILSFLIQRSRAMRARLKVMIFSDRVTALVGSQSKVAIRKIRAIRGANKSFLILRSIRVMLQLFR